MTAPAVSLRTTRGVVELGARPWLMGIVNATPDSFSDAGLHRTLADRLALAERMVAAGADVIDVGGESGVTNLPAITAEEEMERVVPLVERVSRALGVLVSVDTYKPAVARAAIAAGACIINDVTGLRDPAIADVCAQTGAGLIVAHTRAAPKQKLLDRSLDGRIVRDVEAFMRERIELAERRGMSVEQLMLDPGPDLGKTPFQTVQVLGGFAELHALGRPLLLAVSRKDFVGALTGRPPRGRLAGTLAAVAHGLDAGAHVVRVHDVGETAEFITVWAALRGDVPVDPALRLSIQLRREARSGAPHA